MRPLLIILLSLLLTILVTAQDADIDPNLAQQISRLEDNTEAIRGLDGLEPVALAFPSREEVTIFINESFETELSDSILEYEMLFYNAFDFLPADYDLRAGLTALYSDQVAGYYDTETETMHVILTNGEEAGLFLPLLERIIYVHEYTHALQDQHFDLDTFLSVDPAENSDAYLAQLALIEGDATAVMTVYIQATMEANPWVTLLQLGIGLTQMGNITIPSGTPRIIAEELNFPYLAGQRFVQTLFQEDGWNTVNAAYIDNPPLSTEHILHPDRYLAGDNPIEVTFEDKTDLLNTSLDEAWSLAREGVLGEFYLREWLRQYNMTTEQIDTIATGWGGDRYYVYRHQDGSIILQLKIVWDTAQDADEFGDNTDLFAAPIPDTEETPEMLDSCIAGQRTICFTFGNNATLITIASTQEQAHLLIDR